MDFINQSTDRYIVSVSDEDTPFQEAKAGVSITFAVNEYSSRASSPAPSSLLSPAPIARTTSHCGGRVHSPGGGDQTGDRREGDRTGDRRVQSPGEHGRARSPRENRGGGRSPREERKGQGGGRSPVGGGRRQGGGGGAGGKQVMSAFEAAFVIQVPPRRLKVIGFSSVCPSHSSHRLVQRCLLIRIGLIGVLSSGCTGEGQGDRPLRYKSKYGFNYV